LFAHPVASTAPYTAPVPYPSTPAKLSLKSEKESKELRDELVIEI